MKYIDDHSKSDKKEKKTIQVTNEQKIEYKKKGSDVIAYLRNIWGGNRTCCNGGPCKASEPRVVLHAHLLASR